MYLCQLDSINLGHYVKDILDYIGGYIVTGILNKIICSECINLLDKNNFDHEYGHSNFSTSVSRGKLINISNAVSLVIQQLESFQIIILNEQKHHNRSKLLIIESARKSILNKSKNLYFPNSHSTNVDFGSPGHEYNLFTLICQKFINIRMPHYEKHYNMKEVFKNRISVRQKLTKIILFYNMQVQYLLCNVEKPVMFVICK